MSGEGKQFDTGSDGKCCPLISTDSGDTQRKEYTPEQRRQILHQQQQRLLYMRHVSKCSHVHGQCPQGYSDCSRMEELWKHISVCRERMCPYPHCVSTRYVLSHYHKCKKSDCPICEPVRRTIRAKTIFQPKTRVGEAGGGGGSGGASLPDQQQQQQQQPPHEQQGSPSLASQSTNPLDTAVRTNMGESIMAYFQSEELVSGPKLKEMTDYVENHLWMNSASLEQYADVETLPRRLMRWAVGMIGDAAGQQGAGEGGGL